MVDPDCGWQPLLKPASFVRHNPGHPPAAMSQLSPRPYASDCSDSCIQEQSYGAVFLHHVSAVVLVFLFRPDQFSIGGTFLLYLSIPRDAQPGFSSAGTSLNRQALTRETDSCLPV